MALDQILFLQKQRIQLSFLSHGILILSSVQIEFLLFQLEVSPLDVDLHRLDLSFQSLYLTPLLLQLLLELVFFLIQPGTVSFGLIELAFQLSQLLLIVKARTLAYMNLLFLFLQFFGQDVDLSIFFCYLLFQKGHLFLKICFLRRQFVYLGVYSVTSSTLSLQFCQLSFQLSILLLQFLLLRTAAAHAFHPHITNTCLSNQRSTKNIKALIKRFYQPSYSYHLSIHTIQQCTSETKQKSPLQRDQGNGSSSLILLEFINIDITVPGRQQTPFSIKIKEAPHVYAALDNLVTSQMDRHQSNKEESGSQISLDSGSLILEDLPLNSHQNVQITQQLLHQEQPSQQQTKQGLEVLLKHYSLQHLATLMAHLHNTVKFTSKIISPLCVDGFTARLLEKLACRAFVERGFGWLKLKQYLQEHNYALEVDEKQYTKIMHRLLLKVYKGLQYLTEKREEAKQQVEPEEEDKLRLTLSVLCNIGILVSRQQSQCFYSVLQSQEFQQQALTSLFRTLQKHVQLRIDNERGGCLNFYKYESSLESEETVDWSEDMLKRLLFHYVKNNESIRVIQREMRGQFEDQKERLSNGNIKWKLRQLFKAALLKLEAMQDLPQCLSQGHRFRRLDYTGGDKFETLLQDPDGNEVRLALATFMLQEEQEIEVSNVIFTILEVNEYLTRKDNERIRWNLIATKSRNSMDRNEYEFAGKHKKKLVLKHRKKNPPQ